MTDPNPNPAPPAPQPEPQPPVPTPTPPAPTPPTPAPDKKPGGTDDKTNSVKNDIDRAKLRGQRDLAKAQGFNSVEEMVAALAKGKTPTPTPDNDYAQLKGLVESMKTELDQRKQRETEFIAKQNRDAQIRAVETVLKGRHLPNPDQLALDVFTLAGTMQQDISKLIKEDGSTDAEALGNLLKFASEQRPHWFKVGTPGSPSVLAGVPGGTQDKEAVAAKKKVEAKMKRWG